MFEALHTDAINDVKKNIYISIRVYPDSTRVPVYAYEEKLNEVIG